MSTVKPKIAVKITCRVCSFEVKGTSVMDCMAEIVDHFKKSHYS